MDIKNDVIRNDVKKTINKVYKLLPMREEKDEWQKLLHTIMVHLSGMNRLCDDKQDIFFPLLCKLEGLFTLTDDYDFQTYRRTVFECLNLLSTLKESFNNE